MSGRVLSGKSTAPTRAMANQERATATREPAIASQDLFTATPEQAIEPATDSEITTADDLAKLRAEGKSLTTQELKKLNTKVKVFKEIDRKSVV